MGRACSRNGCCGWRSPAGVPPGGAGWPNSSRHRVGKRWLPGQRTTTPPPGRLEPVELSRAMAARMLCLWCPDWPVVAARRRDHALAAAPVVVLDRGVVLAASEEARAEGGRRGL